MRPIRKEIIRNRTPLSIYWPETIELELGRYPKIGTLETELRAAGFTHLRQEEVSIKGWLRDLSPYRSKIFSALRRLSQPSFERGLKRLEIELAKGPVPSISRYLLLWANR
ncbi:MAG: hypothetical protein JO333_09655 [Verrucomicrobia bacterium]|nr:hypothetical protein [Verrucomicrobiota bacterium]